MDPVRFHLLKLMALSAAHYQAGAVADTSSKQKGRGTHSMLLGGSPVLAYPGKVRRGKEYDAFCAQNPDAEILTATDYAKALGMANAVRANRRAMEVLEGEHEVEIDWSYLGRACQSHIDVVGATWVAELKTAVSSEPGRFTWQALKLGYGAQLAFYQEALAATGRSRPTAYVVAVESAPPHVVTVFELTEAALEQGRKSMRLWMERLLACEAANDWPGYVQDIVPLDVPAEDVEITFGGGDDDPTPFDPETGEVAA